MAFERSSDESGTPRGRAEVTTRINPVPEPDTYALLLGGLGVLGAVLRRRARKQAA